MLLVLLGGVGQQLEMNAQMHPMASWALVKSKGSWALVSSVIEVMLGPGDCLTVCCNSKNPVPCKKVWAVRNKVVSAVVVHVLCKLGADKVEGWMRPETVSYIGPKPIKCECWLATSMAHVSSQLNHA